MEHIVDILSNFKGKRKTENKKFIIILNLKFIERFIYLFIFCFETNGKTFKKT